ncbi:MAG TPA: serine hydrolase [Candidatus Competibacteraceae bacterium]|nr:serine hydrolase [Candidatus Competibacteraceae bacterium]HRZ04564.1 serine hydrolase [Candidatus Competibacteraceae bacterium]HSA47705.1 serine hydrolase [Candidatus Competibacteraceae bacterium]
MSLPLLLNRLRLERLPFWLAGMALWMATGAVLAQEGGSVFAAPAIAARAAVLMNPTTGEILFAKEPRLRLPPASTTKVLTALVALERLDLNARVSVSPQAASAPPSRIGLRAGEAALAQDLLYGLMLKSGNDAAETLAEAAGGSVPGFAELMNARAWQIGARDSHFMNPHGLPNDDHYSTAYDLALIFRQAMNHPLFAEIIRTRSAALRVESGQGLYGDWRMIPVVSHNRLLASYEGARGGKTGFTLKARRCFVGEVDRGGVRLIVAILNSPNSGTLWEDARNLLDYGFARYGLAPPPPVRSELEPVMVRRALPPSVRPESESESELEPVMVRRAPAPPAAVQVATVRSVLGKSHGARVVSVQSETRRTTRVAVAKPVAKPKPTLAAKKPSAVNVTAKNSKPASAVAKNSKPASAVAVKIDAKRPVTKVARAEPATSPKQKNSKRGG